MGKNSSQPVTALPLRPLALAGRGAIVLSCFKALLNLLVCRFPLSVPMMEFDLFNCVFYFEVLYKQKLFHY
jgi:hypothetical protein